MNREQAINYLICRGFTNEQVGDVVRALTYDPTTKNNLGVEEVTALAEWTTKLTEASEKAYKKGYADGMKELGPIMSKDKFKYGLMACGCLFKDGMTWYEHNELIKCFEDLGLFEQEPRKGQWIADVDRWGDVVTTVNGYRCDKCNTFNADKDNYCPNCGADMREVEE